MAKAATGLNRIRPLQVTKLKPGDKLGDGGGLWLVASKGNGASRPKQWVFFYYPTPGGKRREIGLGSLQDMDLEAARELAAKLRAAHAKGVDPKAERDRLRAEASAAAASAPAVVTFRHVAEEYIKAKASGWRSRKHHEEWTTSLEAYAYPTLGTMPVADIDVSDVLRVLQPIWSIKPATASRVRGRIEAVLGYATFKGYRTGPNPALWRDGLVHALPPARKVRAVKHHKALSYADIPAFVSALREQPGVSPLALQFLILTAARTGEVIGARWAEIDFDAAVWTIPASRMKSGREHRVPLSGAALAILREMQAARVSDYIFPGRQPQKGLVNMALLEVLRRMGRDKDTTVHGMRSSFREWAAEVMHAQHDVAEACLAHTVGSDVVRAYLRTDFMERRRELMEAWANHCTKAATADNVVPLRA